VEDIIAFSGGLGLMLKQTVVSPIKGKKGNEEILAIFEFHPAICDMKGAPVGDHTGSSWRTE
jgi:hypothetical protein